MPAMAEDSKARQAASVSSTPENPPAWGPEANTAAGLGGVTGLPSLLAIVAQQITADGGWWPFDRFMHAALYTPGLGYYSRGERVFGALPQDGSDFITAPELSPLFGRCVARQVAQGLQAAQADEVWEFGAGTGALAEQVIEGLHQQGQALRRYTIVDVSGGLRERQAQRLARFGPQVAWADTLPERFSGVLLGNEVLDAMPVRLLHCDGVAWQERGVALVDGGAGHPHVALRWADRPTAQMPPHEGPWVPGTVTEIHEQAEAFIRTLVQRLERGLMLFIDYGFPQAEYYHPQRTGGTLMCHQAHRMDAEPLHELGRKDITAHVNFTGIALAAQDAGADVLGYTSQARFLLNCGLVEHLETADLRTRAAAQKLITEHEMGELFKVIALGRGLTLDPLGFRDGDRMHRL
jgi:SAM-dependent MidA family methyltransferase